MDYPSNSHKNKDEEQKEDKDLERITKSDPIRRKQPLGKRFMETFFQGSLTQSRDYVFQEVLLPAAKDLLFDSIRGGASQVIFGTTTGPRGDARSTRGKQGSHVAYNRVKPVGNRNSERDISHRSRARHDFDEIIFSDRIEAEGILDKMFLLMERYEYVKLSEFYELAGVTAQHTDERWGWTDLRGSQVARIRNGYLLDLPRPEPINN